MTEAVHTRAHADLAERARRVLPGGATHASRTYDPRIYVARSSGSRKWLIDGTEPVSYTHLDVYKRQGVDAVGGRACDGSWVDVGGDDAGLGAMYVEDCGDCS